MSLDKGSSRLSMRSTITAPKSHYYQVLLQEAWLHARFTCERPEVRAPFAHLRGTNILANSHVIQLTGTIYELNCRIKETNILSKFHEHWAKNVTSTPRPLAAKFFLPIPTIFKLVRDINKTNVFTNFHDDWAKIVTCRVLTREKCPVHWRPCFFHDLDHFRIRPRHQLNQCFDQLCYDWAKIVTSRVLTRKTAPPTGGHVFQRIGTTFELNQDIIKTNILTNFELVRDFIGTKLLTKFHKNGTRNVACRVFTSKCLRTDERMDGHTTDKDRSQKLT
ncbi:hypothetical protein DPMN_067182 [Dreissena polymorpha]|uniref:Uncharacterized protein n=1 Tax=Dreissena polymorpha TaxID=45954 RepID=A0A9D3YWU9_DREPO|nr:hypothetical protein DPMN_067182 [Dreissena polymorpha]